MEKNDIIEWINNNLIYSRGLICKKCKKEWFEKYGFINQYSLIIELTSFLDNINPTLPQRIWHILNNISEKYKCQNPKCNNTTSFFAFTKGYLRTCSLTCAQFDPQTISTIKSTNLKKYGVEYGLSNKNIISKKNKTVKEKYGVENISQLKEISEKKKRTCLKNYGVEWILQDDVIRKNGMIKKYGVDNNTKREEIREKYSKERKELFYDSLFSTDRLKGKVTPLFFKKDYKGVGIDYEFKCIKCDTVFIDKLEDGDIPRCNICYPTKGSSLFEKEITEYVISLLSNVEIKENDKTILSGLELDIYIPSKNIAIECDGLYWHSEVGGNKNKYYHLNKTELCEEKDIRLLHIFEDEWINNESVVKSKLKHILGKSENKLYARKCKIEEISIKEKNDFLYKNHIQYDDFSNIKLGSFYEKELVAVMTFGKLRLALGNKSSKDGEYEMIRFATSKTVIGIASKLLNHFIKNYNPLKIISYADRRWTFNKVNLYEKIGFKKISCGTPNYWYIPNHTIKRIHRFNFRKQVLKNLLDKFNPELTEWENMKNNGWDRIWDCGHLKYEMNI